MLVANCPTCHTKLNENGEARLMVPLFDTFTCKGCGQTLMVRPDGFFQPPSGGKTEHNDPRTDEGKAEARKAREAGNSK